MAILSGTPQVQALANKAQGGGNVASPGSADSLVSSIPKNATPGQAAQDVNNWNRQRMASIGVPRASGMAGVGGHGGGGLERLRNSMAPLTNAGNFDFNQFHAHMPPQFQDLFNQNFNQLDNMPMHDQLGWWASLFGGGNDVWQRILNGVGGGHPLGPPVANAPTVAGTPRSGQTPG
jgi:hypothetical protein